MKKILLFILIMMFVPICCADEELEDEKPVEQKEILLDLSVPCPKYNLEKVDNINNPKIEKEEDDGIPFDILTSPMRMLKQLQADW